MSNRTTTLLLAITASATVMLASTAPAHASTLLFADNFNRANSTDLNASATGKSGSLAPLTWSERIMDAGGGDVDVNSGGLRFVTGSQSPPNEALDGPGAWVDYNFIGLTALTVSVDITAASSGGEGRESGIAIGQTLANLNAMTGSSGYRTSADIYVGYDVIGADNGILVWEWDGTTRTNIGYVYTSALSVPDTLAISATFPNMNAGTTINYDILLNGSVIASRTAKWSGTDENYISLHSWYSGGITWDNFSIEGAIIPEPSSLVLTAFGLLLILHWRRR